MASEEECTARQEMSLTMTRLTGLLLLASAMGPVLCLDGEDAAPEVKEYCQFEAFNVTCPRDQVIMMRSALYGRMKVGKCVRGEYGVIGCKADVLRFMDSACSGRQHCIVTVPELEAKAKPCPNDLKSYLQASYQCVPVAMGTEAECSASHFLRLADSSGYLATFVTENSPFGSVNCPWVIQVGSGQRIELLVYNFRSLGGSHSPSTADGDPNAGCPLYAVVREDDVTRDLNLCDYANKESHLLTSDSNEIEVYFASHTPVDSMPKFIIYFRETGCPDLVPRANTWIKRDGDNAAIRCNHTQETWYVTCKGNRWIGELGNCSQATSRFHTSDAVATNQNLPQGIIMAVVIGILLGVVIGAVLLAVVFTCRRKQRAPQASKQDPLLQVTSSLSQSDRNSLSSNNYKMHRQCSKSSMGTGDYALRQQTLPLISPRGECPLEKTTDVMTTVSSPPYSHGWSGVQGKMCCETTCIAPDTCLNTNTGEPLSVYHEVDPDAALRKDISEGLCRVVALQELTHNAHS